VTGSASDRGRDGWWALTVMGKYRAEIEQAIDRAKKPAARSKEDRQFRKQWHRAAWWRTHPKWKEHRSAADESGDSEGAELEMVWDERQRRWRVRSEASDQLCCE